MHLPETVNEAEWRRALADLLIEEKRLTRERDALAAKRRRMPALEISPSYEFDGPHGRVTLAELFEGRRQLLLYHFMFPQGGEPCWGCSMFTDQICHLAHLRARDTTLALVSPASQAEIGAHKRRMGWTVPWYTTVGGEFQERRRIGGGFALDVYMRDGDRILLTYEVRSRGVEALGSVWTFLDLTPLGRQEEWEDSPPGRPQGPPYEWWRLHDSYEPMQAGAGA